MILVDRAGGTDGSERPHRGKGMANTRNQETHPSQPLVYQIRLKGHLGPHWADWFAGLTIRLTDNGETLLTGPLLDQAALYGVLRKVRDLDIPLLSVMHVQLEAVPKH
jgi:hypothetical protein